MLREYLVRAGKSSDIPELERLQHLLEDTSNRQQFDEVGGLLSDFAGMQIAPSK